MGRWGPDVRYRLRCRPASRRAAFIERQGLIESRTMTRLRDSRIAQEMTVTSGRGLVYGQDGP